MGFYKLYWGSFGKFENLTFNNFNAIGALTNESILMQWFSGEDKYPMYTFTIYGVTSPHHQGYLQHVSEQSEG
jgi:hypothetical protein